MESLKEILDRLQQEETEQSIRDLNRGAPARLPNADWDENDARDLIDFPCSDSFLDYYHSRGYTPRHSPNYRGQRPDYKSFQLKKHQGKRAGGVEM